MSPCYNSQGFNMMGMVTWQLLWWNVPFIILHYCLVCVTQHISVWFRCAFLPWHHVRMVSLHPLKSYCAFLLLHCFLHLPNVCKLFCCWQQKFTSVFMSSHYLRKWGPSTFVLILIEMSPELQQKHLLMTVFWMRATRVQIRVLFRIEVEELVDIQCAWCNLKVWICKCCCCTVYFAGQPLKLALELWFSECCCSLYRQKNRCYEEPAKLCWHE